jgi:hypothetical protein
LSSEDKRFYGIYEGICTNNSDPDAKHKIKLQVPQVLGSAETNWAKPCLPVVVDADHGDNGGLTTTTSSTAVATYGTHSHVVTLTTHAKVPTIGQKVWVMFIAGDPNYPVWMGVQL